MNKIKNIENIKDMFVNQNPVLKPILLLSIPIILNSLFLILHDIIDIGFLAYIPLNTRQDNYNFFVETIGISSIYFSLFISVGIAISISISSILYKNYYNKEVNSYKSIASKLILILFFLGLLISIIALLLSAVYINFYKFDYENYSIANDYNKIKSTSLLFVFIYLGYQTIKQTQNSISKSISINIFSLIMHIVLNYIFIYLFNFQLNGLGYSFLITFISLTIFILFDLLLDKKKNIRIESTIVFNKDLNFKELIKKASLPFIVNILNTIGLLIIIYMSTTYSQIFSSGFIISFKFISIFNVIALSITQSLSSFITNNLTYKSIKRIQEAYNGIKFFLIMLSIIFAFGLIFLGDFLLNYYININNDTPIDIIQSYKFAKFYLYWFILIAPITSLLYVDLAYLTGINYQKHSLAIQFIRIWLLRIPIVLSLSYFLIYSNIRIENSIWIGFLLSNLISYIIALYYKYKYVLKGEIIDEKQI